MNLLKIVRCRSANSNAATHSKAMNNKISYLNQRDRIRGLITALFAALFVAACATPVGEVANWPITNAEKSELTGEVVSVLCELGGNCDDNCGGGTQQLAIKTADLGTVLVSKNINNYSGAQDELSPFCGQTLNVNGLFTEHQGIRFFQVHNLRTPGGDWQRANRYLQAWAERSGKAPANRWYNQDERVKEILQRDGRLGLGPEADKDFF